MIKDIKSRWYKVSIKNKLLIFFTTVIVCVSWISFYSNNEAYKFVEQFKDNLNSHFTINKLFVQLQENTQVIKNYLKNMKKEDLEKYKESVNSINTTLEQVEKNSKGMKMNALIRAIKNSLISYYRECDIAISIRKDMYNEQNYYEHVYKAVSISTYIQNYVHQLLYVSLSESSLFYNELANKVKIMRIITFSIIILIFLLCMAFGIIFSNLLLAPIKKLAQASIEISEGNLNVKKIWVKSTDELGILANSFNKMSANLRTLVNDLRTKSIVENKLHEEELKNLKMQQLLKEAKFVALQSQINPHFLFNTLNTISRTSMFEEAGITTKLIQSLSNLLRYSLGNHTKEVPLSKELNIIKEYLYIQQYRFKDRIKFDIKCNMDIDHIYIPCFTLQPLVENAIIHGIEPKEKGGKVRIKIMKKNNKVFIKIIDNGLGISKERLQHIFNHKEMNSKGHTTMIGIKNVMNRLNIYFNDEDSFKIKSKLRLGTVVVISFVEKKKEGE
ncbi:sensor histidine kinase [Crassaminicella profunda]|uniref:sensor histidine kinase n=1 Tax=Crassaminicella profunda TaxID=1286698 RepID=UPI001CA7A821|nr:histidine kinase [Crassaminicella profunda]QZY54676.1 histidine kinase [Crassaminicella profunda]